MQKLIFFFLFPSAFSMNIPNIPIQILAVTETGSANAFFSSDLSHQLITEGNAVADKLQAHFMTSSSTSQQKSNSPISSIVMCIIQYFTIYLKFV